MKKNAKQILLCLIPLLLGSLTACSQGNSTTSSTQSSSSAESSSSSTQGSSSASEGSSSSAEDSSSASEDSSESKESSSIDDKWAGITEKDLKETKQLTVAVMKTKTLELAISHKSDLFLANMTKNDLLVFPKLGSGTSDPLTIKDALAKKIDNFTFSRVNGKLVKVTIPSFQTGIYHVLFSKSVTSDGKLAEASAYTEQLIPEYSSYSLESNQFQVGQVDPTFVILHNKAKVADQSLISFTGGFEGLKVKSVKSAPEKTEIFTEGSIQSSAYGSIVLKKGFFEGTKSDLRLEASISERADYIVQESFAFDSGVLSFDLYVDGKLPSSISQNDFTFSGKEGYELVSVAASDKSNIIHMQVRFGEGVTDISGAIKALEEAKLEVSASLTGLYGSKEINLSVRRPRLRLYPSFDGSKLTIKGTVSNAKALSITKEDLAFTSTNLIFTGDNSNVENSEFELEGNTFVATYTIKGSANDLYGTITIQSDKVQSLWGEATEVHDHFDASKNGQGSEIDDTSCQELIDNQVIKDNVQKGIYIYSYYLKIGASIASKNPVAAIDNLMGLLEACGILKPGPSIQDVLNRLDQLDKKLDIISGKIDHLSDQIADSQAATAAGIDLVLYNQYRANWSSFVHNYVEPMDDMIRSYRTKVQTDLVNTALSSDPLPVKIQFAQVPNGEGSPMRTLVTESPTAGGKSLEFATIEETYEISIPTSYFAKAQEEVASTRCYSADFCSAYQEGIQSYLKEHPSQYFTAEDIYNSIISSFQKEAITSADTLKFYNLYTNFASSLPSCMNDYVKMLQNFYNFQTEAENEILMFRGNMKRLLVQYVGFLSTFASYSGVTGIDMEAVVKSTSAAENFIKANTYIVPTASERTNYCYTVSSPVTTYYMEVYWATHFEPENTNHPNLVQTKRFTYYGPDGKEVAEHDNPLPMLSEADLLHIQYRYKTIENYTGATDTWASYLEKNGVIDYEGYSKTFKEVRRNLAEEPGDFPPIICEVGEFRQSSATGWKGNCWGHSVGDKFKLEEYYDYACVDSEYWSENEVTGKLLNFETLETTDTVLLREAIYHESHWWWNVDEYWIFYSSTTGRHGIAFVRG